MSENKNKILLIIIYEEKKYVINVNKKNKKIHFI